MTHTAYIFPGQGSQEVGMGKAFYDNFVVAKEVFQEVDDALNMPLSRIIFEGDAETLTRTENAQPAIMATSLAIMRTLEKEAGIVLASQARFAAGHSLGEYSALCAAKVLTLADAARLLRIRGRAMQEAAPTGTGTMAAILGLSLMDIEAIVAAVEGVCEIANDNSEGQVVISGEVEAIQAAMLAAKEKGAKRAIELNVSAPFHCSLIENAADIMKEALDTVSFSRPSVPIVCNVTAQAETHADTLKSLLVQQVTGRVRWRESVEWMVAQGITKVVEIGHGAVLTGLCRRIHKDLTCQNINTIDAIDGLLKAA
jgi:[acyl-carrier-protein] S-malonyltransferase